MTSVDSVPAFLLAGVPVLQPPHLEGDPALATEILPGPPSLLTIQQSGLPRKDHKKTAQSFSYLPVSDPGTTYGGHMVNPMVTTSITEVDGPRRKRARLDKGSSSGRAQRASARQLAAPDISTAVDTLASSSHIPDSDPIAVPLDDDDPMLMSRSNSVPNADLVSNTDGLPNADDDSSASAAKRPRRDKGKGKEKEIVVRVKEEPGTMSLGLHDAVQTLSNEDHCSSCRSLGSLVYCDGCPRAFHLVCLNPPMETDELPQGDANWYCPACILRQNPPSKPPASFKFMTPLFDHLQSTIPVEYQLPADVRTFFKDVAMSNRGTFVDSSEIKPPRLNRHGQLEDRDPYRLKDRNGDPVLCFKCGTSALPPGVAPAVPAMKRPRRASSRLSSTLSDSGRGIISCDYCHLHWHLDCVDPPLAVVPPWGKKWMCPNHADQILKPKRRIPRSAQPIDIVKPGEANNGHIEIIQPEASVLPLLTKMSVEEVLINGRRYRVPEKIITMDFWNKTRRREHVQDEDLSSAVSSPLTSLSSLEDGDEAVPSVPQPGLFNVDELKAALFLIGLQSKKPSVQQLNGISPFVPVVNGSTTSKRIATTSAATPAVKIKEEPDLHINGLLGSTVPSSSKRASRANARASRATTTKAVRTSARVQAALQLSAAKKHADSEQYQETADGHGTMLPPPPPKSGQKALPNGITAESELASQQSAGVGESVSSASVRPKRARQSRRKQSPAPLAVKAVSFNGSASGQMGDTSNLASSSASAIDSASHDKPLTPSISTDSTKKRTTSTAKARSQKPITPAPSMDKPAANTPISTPTTSAGPSKLKTETIGSTTPSLKIRLPRLASISSPSLATSSTVPTADREATKSSTTSRSKPPRSRRVYNRPSSASTSNDGPASGGADGIMLPPV